MEIKRDWAIRFEPERFLALQGDSFVRLLERPERRQAWEEALVEAYALIEPAAIWDAFPVREFLHERIVLEGGVRIGGGPVVSVVRGASHLQVGVCTVGNAISERAITYQRQRELFRSMLISDLGSWAVDQVRQGLCRHLEAEATARGWRASASLSPGESEWSVKEQAIIFKLLDAERIGVTLSDSMVMTPLKSLSLIMGTGAGPLGVEGASNCDFCTIRDRCTFREARLVTPESGGASVLQHE